MVLAENPKRACIYFIYDKSGIIDRYVVEQLKDMRKNVSFLHCVINGNLTPEGKVDLLSVADEVYIRENKGNDVGAYKAAIEYVGWEKLSQYDELVLMNNTCFGPVYPFREVFDWANGQDIDCWGLTWGEKADWLGTKDFLHYNSRKDHIQSYFLAVRKPLLASQLLTTFFEEIPEDVSYIQSGSYYEYAFPGYFEDRGYKCAVYCDIKDDLNYPLLHDPVRLLRDYRMPLFKKRSFFHHYSDALNNTAGEATVRLLRFLGEETDYNVDLIWESVLRDRSLSDVVRCAQLNRILPRDFALRGSKQNTQKAAIVYHAYYEELFDEAIAYIKNFPENTGILITTNSIEKQMQLKKKLQEAGRSGEVIVVEDRGRNISALLVGAAKFVVDYDLVCFAHDKRTTQFFPHSIGRSWAYKIHENTFATKEYVANVIDLFSNEPRLGIAFPSFPNHSSYAKSVGTGWGEHFSSTKKLLVDFGVEVKLNEHTLCVAPLSSCFWFRPQALKRLFDGINENGWSYNDFPQEPVQTGQTILHAIERSYAYFSQDAGYYPVFLYNDRFAEIELTNLEFHKVGSTEMKAWMEVQAMSAIGYLDVEDTFHKSMDDLTSEEVLQYYEESINYGIKGSLKHLALALRCRFPRFWALMLPLRRIGKKTLGIKTR